MTLLKKILTLNVVGASFLIPGMTYAQRTFPIHERDVIASGGNFINYGEGDNYVEIESTIRQMAVKSWVYEGWLLTQGFIQPPLQGRVNETNLDDMILWPNPTSDQLSIRYTLDSNVTKVDIRVLSTGGHIMYTETIASDNVELLYVLNCARFIPGIYVVSLIMDSGIKVSKKFIKIDAL